MDERDVIQLLEHDGCHYTLFRHEPFFSASDGLPKGIPSPEASSKSLFLHDSKRLHWYLATLPLFERADLKRIAEAVGSKRLSFASKDELQSYLNITPGSVTPFALFQVSAAPVVALFDTAFDQRDIYVHPMHNGASLKLACNDLIRLLEQAGRTVVVAQFAS
ncbi:MAG: hypothetical protein LKF61_04695 [Eggerthellaceae bacterium]|jgi:Ala-tRNA(Pro) deacylase|nr:hypothetical protein [Eggerthellaceae bacterium]MCH4221482.1 hypothetical protein [Eggerthellaceae bacterium]